MKPPITVNTMRNQASRPGAASRSRSSGVPMKRGSSGNSAGRTKTKYAPRAISHAPQAVSNHVEVLDVEVGKVMTM